MVSKPKGRNQEKDAGDQHRRKPRQGAGEKGRQPSPEVDFDDLDREAARRPDEEKEAADRAKWAGKKKVNRDGM